MYNFIAVATGVAAVVSVFGVVHNIFRSDLSTYGVVTIGAMALFLIALAALSWANNQKIKDLESELK